MSVTSEQGERTTKGKLIQGNSLICVLYSHLSLCSSCLCLSFPFSVSNGIESNRSVRLKKAVLLYCVPL